MFGVTAMHTFFRPSLLILFNLQLIQIVLDLAMPLASQVDQ